MALEETDSTNLRARIVRLRQELNQATVAYRNAVAKQDSANVVKLLRARSQLMRELLESQGEHLLRLRSQAPPPPAPAQTPSSLLQEGAVA